MLVEGSSVVGKMLDASDFNLDLADRKDVLVADEDEDENEGKNAEKIGNWIMAAGDLLSLGKEVDLAASISLLIALLSLLYLGLSIKLQ